MGFESMVFCVKSRPWRSWVCGVRAMKCVGNNCKVEVVGFTDLMRLVVSRRCKDGSVTLCLVVFLKKFVFVLRFKTQNLYSLRGGKGVADLVFVAMDLWWLMDVSHAFVGAVWGVVGFIFRSRIALEPSSITWGDGGFVLRSGG